MTKLRYILSILCLFVGACPHLKAEYYRVTSYSPSDGLSQANVRYIYQDNYGYIWLCTADGLNRYDGVNNTIFRKDLAKPRSVGTSNFLCIMQDDDNNYWIGSDGDGIFRYETTHNRFTGYKVGNGIQSIRNIVSEGDNELWVLSEGIVYLISKPGSTDTQVEIRHVLHTDNDGNMLRINAIQKFEDNLLLCSDDGLKRVRRMNEGYEVYGDGSFDRMKIVDLKTDETGTLWVATENRILKKEKMKEVEEAAVFDDEIVSFVVEPEVGFWIFLKERGLIRKMYGKNIEEVTTNKYAFFVRNQVTEMMIDNSMSLWLCSNNRGVVRINLLSNAIRSIKRFGSLMLKYPTAIAFDKQGKLWIGTEFEGLLISVDGESYIHKHTEERIKSVIVGESRQWVATSNNLWAYDPTDVKQSAVDVFARLGIRSRDIGSFAVCGAPGNILWLVSEKGLSRIEYIYGDFRIKQFEHSLTGVNVIIRATDGSVWVGTEYDGAFRFIIENDRIADVKNLTKGNGTNALSDNHVRALYQSCDGTVLIGTDNGLNAVDPGSVFCQIYNEIPAKIISISEDGTGRLWLGTSRNLTSFDRATGEVRIYNSSNGLTSSFVTGATHMDDNGFLYVGNMDGIDYFKPESFRINTYEPRPTINHFLLNNRIVLPGDTVGKRILLTSPIQDIKTIRLRHNERSFGIEYIALQYNDVPGNRISYMLKGYDKDFVYPNESAGIAQYSNLDPGAYRFILRARNNDGTWSDQDHELNIVIGQTFWKTWWAYLLYLVLGATILYLVFKYMQERFRLMQNLLIEREKLKNERWLAEEKSKFYGNITHELKTPLSLIVSPVKELSEHTGLDDFSRKRIEIIRNNSDKLQALINEFLDFRRIESQNNSLRVSYANLTEFISGVKINFNHIAEEKKIHYVLTNELTDPRCWFDPSKLSKIVNNLLSNAFKFTNENGYIYLFVSQTEMNFTITVADSGRGVSIVEQKKIFDRFYRGESVQHVEGVGIGLALVKSMVLLHKGSLDMKSVEGAGTSISVTIPCQESNYTTDEQAKIPSPEDPGPPVSDLELSGKPLVVLVEDNQELAEYIHEVLSDTFNVKVYSNGHTAFEEIIKLSPDLIVSDVRMDDGDGIELCDRVKRNIVVSHIPFVLLTAMNAEEDVARGYAAGAEDYITKPFDIGTLKLKINNMISFTRGGNRREELEKAKIPPREKTFIEKVGNLIENNLDNPHLNSQFVCDELAVSRMQLYRKLTTYTGKSISEFIRSIRLERAREMLNENRYSISEILYRVGFNNHSYFTKTFREEFGITPTDYLNGTDSKI